MPILIVALAIWLIFSGAWTTLVAGTVRAFRAPPTQAQVRENKEIEQAIEDDNRLKVIREQAAIEHAAMHAHH